VLQDARGIYICKGTACLSAGSKEISDAFKKLLAKSRVRVMDKVETGCHGFCDQGPIVLILPENVLYVRVNKDDVEEIVREHVEQGKVVERLLYTEPGTGKRIARRDEIPFYQKQKRFVLKHCGYINPENIEDYLDHGGYRSFIKVLEKYSPEKVIDIIKDSGLRGRGGGGFSTGLKWEITRSSPGEKKYVICNADEGDPGAFMDRGLLEGDPHRVLEGMLIGGYAVGAGTGYVYVRAEYPLAVKRIKIAVAHAKKKGFLGKDILGTGFNFEIYVKEGAGAFVCGEETALIQSIEGKRGMPKPRPPYPAQSGLWGRPTVINNVETWANVPLIIEKGAEFYKALGTKGSRGTKIFALTGKVNNTGLLEVPMGITLREIIFDMGGGIPENKRFKAVQIGGPSGGCLPEHLLDTPVDYDSLTEAGAMMGSGGLVVLDESTCMVDFARYFTAFARNEACGKCVPGREGTLRMLEIMNRITQFQGEMKDLDRVQELGLFMKSTALCGLCQTAPNPVLSTLKYFGDEYVAHIRDRECPAGVCRGLVKEEDNVGRY